MADMKLCKDCKHFVWDGLMAISASCGRVSQRIGPVDPVFGGPEKSYASYCSTERNTKTESACGPDGRFWEARQ